MLPCYCSRIPKERYCVYAALSGDEIVATKEWQNESVQEWARAIGLVSTPLFGEERARRESGTHSVLLDGDRGSFVLSRYDGDEDLDTIQS